MLPTTEEEWKKKLSEEQYHVLREKGTERPFTGIYDAHFEKGIYTCAGCGTELFSSEGKFDGHCGWPAFSEPVQKEKVNFIKDESHGMFRVEITCANCDGHLGHVFNDGPLPKGYRYCINSISLDFKKA
jgi:peptide-methionine (R)-S-oxide reductase